MHRCAHTVLALLLSNRILCPTVREKSVIRSAALKQSDKCGNNEPSWLLRRTRRCTYGTRKGAASDGSGCMSEKIYK